MREDALCEKIVGIQPSGIRRFYNMVLEMEGAVSLCVGEPDFETPQHIREAGIGAINSGKTFYTKNPGLLELRQEIAAHIRRDQGTGYDEETEICVTVGGSEAIDMAMRALLNPGDEVLIPEPSYVAYGPCATLAGGKPVIIDLKAENRFRLQPEEIEAAVTPRTKLLVLLYPNNPTGAIMEKADLEKLVPVITKHDLIVISDEIYSALTYGDKKHVSIASLPGMRERTVMINGFSKAYAMTGWRLGYACGPEFILKQMIKVHQYGIMCAPAASQYAGIEAMRRGGDDVRRMCAAYDGRRRYVLEALRSMNIPCFEPEGAFYVFPCIKEFGLSSEEFALRLLREEKAAIIPGTAFGKSGEGFLRISCACSLERLREAMQRLERFIGRLRGN